MVFPIMVRSGPGRGIVIVVILLILNIVRVTFLRREETRRRTRQTGVVLDGRRRSRDDKECEWVLDEVAGRRKEREGGREGPRSRGGVPSWHET